MTDDRLDTLLRRADADWPLTLRPDLARTVRAIDRTRRRARAIAAAATVLLAVAGSVLWVALPGGTRTPPSLVSLASLEQQAKIHEELAQRLWQAERNAARAVSPAPAPDPLAVIERQRERAAMIILYQADRHLRDAGIPAEAIRAYRQAAELFPETRSAQVARQRLQQIENGKEG